MNKLATFALASGMALLAAGESLPGGSAVPPAASLTGVGVLGWVVWYLLSKYLPARETTWAKTMGRLADAVDHLANNCHTRWAVEDHTTPHNKPPGA